MVCRAGHQISFNCASASRARADASLLALAAAVTAVPIDVRVRNTRVSATASGSLSGQFSPRGGCVTIAARGDGGRVEFVVEDEGPGIPDYALGRIFERFYSLERPATGRKSTGLGLALVREIAHLHGGEVELVNRPDRGGAQATLRLPTA